MTVHVDLDGAREIFAGHGWPFEHEDDSIVETGLRNFLELCAAHQVTATLFVIANMLARKRIRPLIEEAVRQGHEIASHTVTHRYLPALDRADKKWELEESRRILEGELGVPVIGFRAPGYRIDRESIELLADCGYAYDSSAFPTSSYAAALGTTVAALMAPHAPIVGSPFVEWPMPKSLRLPPLPLNPSYALLLGNGHFKRGIASHRRSEAPLTLLFHLIDVAEPLPTEQLRGFMSRVMTLSTMSATAKMRRCNTMLAHARGLYRPLRTTQALAEWRTSLTA
ncbi:MAG: polysaccharide deacetylase family protein [Gemmatimonas sp.]